MINLVASLSVNQALTLQAASSDAAGQGNSGVVVSGTVEIETSVEISLSAQRLKDAREALDMLNRLLETLRSGGDSRWMKLGQLVDRTFDRLVQANADTVIFGTRGNDVINAWSNSAVYGRGGDDAIAAWSDSYVDGGAGNDVIKAWSGSTVHGGAGDDVIDAWSDSTVDGGAGNDVIKAWSGSTVRGGTGNDVISLGGDSTAIFNTGDGHDVINTRSNDTIRFGSGLGADQIRFSFDGDKTIITFDGNEQDSITLTQNVPGNSATLAFADGTTIKVPINPDSVRGTVAASTARASDVHPSVNITA